MATWNASSTGGAQPPPAVHVQYSGTAYTPVQVRQSFGAPPPYFPVPYSANIPPPPSLPPADEGPKKKIEWPLSVRSYVQRSFLPANLDASISRTEMEVKLKETISHANQTNVMHSIDWDSMPLPQQLIREERARALYATATMVQQQSQNAAAAAAVAAWPHYNSSEYSKTNKSDFVNSKKRKSNDFHEDDGSSDAPPWRINATPLSERVQQADKLERASKKEKKEKKDKKDIHYSDSIFQPSEGPKSKFQKKLEERKSRFGVQAAASDIELGSLAMRSESPDSGNGEPIGPVVGTSEKLEKSYLRLTSAPNPALVRPERVLRQALDLLKKAWRQHGDYGYICDQFKAMRQDLTVQRIRNDFTVLVYEIHARIALEKGDLGEYNQCQTQLMALYQQGLKGNPIEFKAYRVLYFIHTVNQAALNNAMADLTPAEKKEEPIRHALQVRSALALGNYHRFFQLYLATPNMGAYLMDMFVARERLVALCSICKAYKPDVRLRYITEELGFESDIDAAQFIIDHKAQELLEERDDHIAFLSAKGFQKFNDAREAAFRRIKARREK
ncbi:hypothetical protein SEPCBS119000_000773 [Sporothrix epigloea]|uniref:SAC3/GANP/THP3 conserved domain-containing protein n=1 Tax=Sporothrix epigloea TaxID=1892477 RepID=A0ABP0D700_9PEZI